MTRLIQISDTHLVAAPQLVSGRLDTRTLLQAAVDRIAADLEKIGPVDGLIVTGDISDDGSAESYRLAQDTLASLELPLYFIPGNHDDRQAMFDVFSAPQGEDVNKFHWSARVGEIQLIGLDTTIPRSGGGDLDKETLNFLAAELSNSKNLPTIVALHHPPFASGIKFMDKIGLRGVDGLREVLEGASAEVRLICGHLHSSVIASVGRHIAISSPATCSSFEADYRDNAPVGFTTRPGGYMIHQWVDGFRSTCVPLTVGSGPHPF